MPEFVYIIGILIIFIYWIFSKKIQKDPHIIFLSVLIILMTIYALYHLSVHEITYLLNYSIILTPMNQFIKVVILLITILILITSFHFIDKNLFEFCILILLTTFGLLALISINDLVLISLCLELQSLGLYALIGFLTKSSLSKEATLKYFIFGSISSIFIGFGISLIYVEFGTTNLNELDLLINDLFINKFVVYGLFFFWIGYFFKLALVPFHFWIADVYQGAPLIVTFFLATVPKIANVYLVLKLIFLLNVNFFIYLVLISIIYGTVMSIYQVKLTRFLGYSSMTHIGFAILGILQCSMQGEIAGMLYIIGYSFLYLNLFLVILSLRERYSDISMIELVDFSNLIKTNKIISFMFIITLFSIGGVPPLAGFFFKWYIFNSIITAQNNFLALCLIVISIINMIFYIRLARLIYFNENIYLIIKNFVNIDRGLLVILIYQFFFNTFFLFFHMGFIEKLFNFI